ncbi:cleavage stimulation factor subunit 1 [Patella vulgata]|uniref:cleavage stimulation factor subunit 1 n=1 Tax=Patella vulgata TaxID=6465 RepID=UPI0021804651|nr:cleavage stimulation factor subunit 1 [Patella vulgata]
MGDLEIKRREQLYRLIISQLFYDGYKEPAFKLCEIFKPHPTCPPSDRLLQITKVAFQLEDEKNEKKQADTVAPGSGIDLEFETEVQSISAEAALYETCYVTAHKGACRTAAFHHSGQIIATGSEDASIKILDVERMLAKSATPAEMIAMETPQQQMENHPVIRTLYDHNDEVSCLDFHPFHQILASGSKDYSIKFFEYSKPSVKKAYKSIQEVSPVRCISFHPSGEYLLVGVNHPTLRLYDVNTFQCYVANNPSFQHTAPVTDISWSPNANMFVTCSKDGDIKLWDGVSQKCFNTFKNAHDSREVTSVLFSRNSKYVLSSGKDSLVKLWELSTNRCLIVYTGAGATGRMEHRTRATFNHTEDYVLFPDEKTTSLCCWDSRNAERQRLLALGHNGVVRSIVHSPTGPAFISCSEDCRARFWYRKATTD